MLNFCSTAPKLSLISSVGPSANTEMLFSWLSESDNELLSTAKNTTFLAKSLQKLHDTTPSNAIPYPLYTWVTLLLFLYH